MPFTDTIGILIHDQARLLHQRLHVIGVIHPAFAVGDAGKIQRGRIETEAGGLVLLPVPEQINDVEYGVAVHDRDGVP